MNIIISKRGSFRDQQEASDTKALLMEMTEDSSYNTSSSYSPNSAQYPDNVMPFVDKHMAYLQTHSVELHHYLSNLRLMARIR